MDKFIKAVTKGDVQKVTEMVEKENIDINALSHKDGLAALHIAFDNGDREMVSCLLEMPNIDVNLVDKKNGWSVLLHGIFGNNDDLTKALINKKGCNVFAEDENGNTALHWAAMLNKTEIIDALLQRDPKVMEAVNHNRETPLHVSLLEGREEAACFLMERNADLNSKDVNGRTPLHVAVKSRNYASINAIVQYMKEGKMDISTCVDNDGCTPMHIAAQLGLSGLTELLRQNGFDDQTPNNFGKTPEELLKSKLKENQVLEEKKAAAKEMKSLQKRKEAETSMNNTEVGIFLIENGLNNLVETFYRKKYFYIDEAFLDIEAHTLSKMGIKGADSYAFLDAKDELMKEKRIQREKKRKEAAEMQKAAFNTKIKIAIGLMLTVFAGLYAFLKFIEIRKSGKF